MTALLFLCGLALSAVAAYYSVMGLIAIFSTAVIPIAIMGSVLEASKLVSASWLYRNWHEIPKLLKLYFTTAVVVLMILTSMGIFGYLSKAHLDQAVPTGDIVSKLSLIDEKIKTEKENIDASRKAISQLDSQVDQTLSRTTDDKGADRSVAIRRSQAKERANLINEIQTSQAKIAKLNEERAPIASEVRKVEAEVGPIKYIAALIYNDQKVDDTLLEKAVRIVILMIVFVFDPLAVLLLIAANREMMKTKPEYEPDDGPLTEEQIEQIQHPFVVDVDERPTEEEKKPDPWDKIAEDLVNYKQQEPEVVAAPVVPEPELPKENNWLIAEPPKEVPEEFRKVVNEYFHKEDKTQAESMLFVNEEPEAVFKLDPDFNHTDPFMEKARSRQVVMPDSRVLPVVEAEKKES